MLLFVEPEYLIRVWATNLSIFLFPIFFFPKITEIIEIQRTDISWGGLRLSAEWIAADISGFSGQTSVEGGWDYQQSEYQQIWVMTVSWSCPTSGVFLSPSSPSSPPPSSSPSLCWSSVASWWFVPVSSSLVFLPDDVGVLRVLLSLPLDQISKARH